MAPCVSWTLGREWPGPGGEGEFSLGRSVWELGEAGRQAGTGGVWAKACSGTGLQSGVVAMHRDCDRTGGKVWSERRRGPQECTIQDHLRSKRCVWSTEFEKQMQLTGGGVSAHQR